jgi:WhiB family transcriptional regulator, redox-sensing transcriptional regulator
MTGGQPGVRASTARAALGAVYDRAPTSEEVHWQLRGLCREHDPRLWTPDPPGVDDKSKVAKSICLTPCPVLDQCRTWALEHKERYGVWGGMTESDRDRFHTGRRRQQRDNAAAAAFYSETA